MKNYIIVAIVIIFIIVGVVWYQAKNSTAPVDEDITITETIPATGEMTITTEEGSEEEETEEETPVVE